MLIKEVKNFLIHKNQAVLGEIYFHLKQDKELILHALHLLIQKGVVESIKLSTPCKGCSCSSTCDSAETIIYKFKEKK